MLATVPLLVIVALSAAATRRRCRNACCECRAGPAMLQRGYLPGRHTAAVLCCKFPELQLRFISTQIVQGVTKHVTVPFPTLRFGRPSYMVRRPCLPPPHCSTCGTCMHIYLHAH